MKTHVLVIILLFSLFFIGCPTRSISPLFADSDLSFNPGLIGTWKNMNENEIMTMERYGKKEYRALLAGNEGDTARYAIQLGTLGSFWFMDSSPAGSHEDFHYLPLHLFWKVQIGADTLRVSALEGDWLKQMIESKQLNIAHLERNGETILTASTHELQEFVVRYANNENAFPKPTVYVRVQ